MPPRAPSRSWARVRVGVSALYAGLAYVTSLALIFVAAMLTGTHARESFIYIFLPGVLLAILSPFVWRGSRSAMLLAFMISVVVQLMIVDSDPVNWRIVMPVPIVFGALTVAGLRSATRPTNGARAPKVSVELFAVMVYFTGVLAVFMAPFNYSRQFGWPGLALYAALVGVAAGMLSALIWRGSVTAMLTTFVLSLLHWVLLSLVEPALWQSIPNIAAAAVSGVLVVACLTMTRGGSSAAAVPNQE